MSTIEHHAKAVSFCWRGGAGQCVYGDVDVKASGTRNPGALAFRTNSQTTAVFLGKTWKQFPGGVSAKYASANDNKKFQTIVVEIRGAEESCAAGIASQIDWAKLKELMY